MFLREMHFRKNSPLIRLRILRNNSYPDPTSPPPPNPAPNPGRILHKDPYTNLGPGPGRTKQPALPAGPTVRRQGQL